MQDEINKAENSAAYNIKPMSLSKQKQAHIHLMKRITKLPFNSVRNMDNNGVKEPHILVHRGIGAEADFNPNAKGKNKLKVSNSHIGASTDSVHSLIPDAANEFTRHGNPDTHPEYAGTKFEDVNKYALDLSDYGSPQFLKRQTEWKKSPKFKKWLKMDEQRKQDINEFEVERHKAGKSGILSFWVPLSSFNAHGSFIDPEDGQADEQEHISIKPGQFKRATQEEVESIHGKDHGLPFLHPKLEKSYMELQEIEELFKNVNRGAIKAFLRNAAVLKDPAATPEMKALAAENVKAISMNKPIPKPKAEPKPKKQKAAVAEQAIQPVQQPVTQTPAAANPTSTGKIKYEYSPVYQHYGVTEDMWHKTPEAHADLFNHHNEVMAGKHPGLAHIKTAVEQAVKPKMAKSIDSLYNLFSQLKKRV